MQHVLTLVKVRPTKEGRAYIQRFLACDVGAELEQKKNPWLLYWCQWYDPWSMSQELVLGLPVCSTSGHTT